MKLLKNIFSFYLTILIPLLYIPPLYFSYQSWQSQALIVNLWTITALIITFLGLGLWFAGYYCLGRSFSVVPQAKLLKTSGVYRYLRHPIYAAIVITYLGLAFLSKSYKAAWYTLIVVVPLLIIRAVKEEKILIKKFGQEYQEYKNQTLF